MPRESGLVEMAISSDCDCDCLHILLLGTQKVASPTGCQPSFTIEAFQMLKPNLPAGETTCAHGRHTTSYDEARSRYLSL
jgi:hypothetical protein